MSSRIETGVKDFDEMLGGGLFEGSSMLVKGAPGTGKTTLGLEFIYNGITKYDESGLVVTFEEFPEKLYRDALSFGWDLEGLEKKKKLRVMFTSPAVFLRDLKSGSLITKLVSEINLKRVLIDPMTYFQLISANTSELRKTYGKVLYGLQKHNITSILTKEIEDNWVDFMCMNDGLSYAVDSVVSLRFVEMEGSIKKAIMILKSRGSDHEKDIKEFVIDSSGINIRKKFNKVEGILNGNTRKVISDRIEKYFLHKA